MPSISGCSGKRRAMTIRTCATRHTQCAHQKLPYTSPTYTMHTHATQPHTLPTHSARGWHPYQQPTRAASSDRARPSDQTTSTRPPPCPPCALSRGMRAPCNPAPARTDPQREKAAF
eukprot:5969561-Prymnesium_polylepis.1